MSTIHRAAVVAFFALMVAGCAPEPKKGAEATPEEKSQLDAQHGAATEAAKSGQGVVQPEPGAAPAAAGHGR